MKKTFITLVLMLLYAMVIAQNGWRKGEMEVRIYLDTITDYQLLSSLNLNMESASPFGWEVNAFVTPGEYLKICKAGLRNRILIGDLNEHYKNFWTSQLIPPGYYSYEQIISIADSLATAFPSICKKVVWGTSVGGRQLAVLKISKNVDQDEAEAEILFDGGIHGDEIGGSENLIRYARDLCTGYGINPTYTGLIDSREIWLYLMVNPDGRVNMSRYNNNGIDCNRDFGYMWDTGVTTPGAFSQIESQSLRNCMLDNQFVVYTDYHSGSEIIAYPWSYRSQSPADVWQINQLAGIYSSVSGYSNLLYGQGYNIMYPINGSTKDFSYGALGNIGWSIEISNSKQPPVNQISLFYNDNVPAMTEMIQRCGWGMEGIVTDSVTETPVRATTWINNYYPVNTDPLVGDYHKYILPGFYTLKVTANGYKTKTQTAIQVPTEGSATRDIQLIPEDKWYAFRVIACEIPGNNFGDEGYTPGALGAPDNIAYSLGRSGWIILDMGDTIYDGPGNDLIVYETGNEFEGFECSVSNSMDGPWHSLGSGIGTTGFTLSYASVDKARYIKITDDGDGTNYGPDIGFDLDAVEMLTPPLIVDFKTNYKTPCSGTTIDFTDFTRGDPVSWNWYFPGGTPNSSTEKNPTNILYATPGAYDVSLTTTNVYTTVSRLRTGYITVLTNPEVNLGNDTTIAASASIILDAGNPGSTFLWSTGETTRTIVADSVGIGEGSHPFSVIVTDSALCSASDTVIITFDPHLGMPLSQETRMFSIFPNPSDGNFTLKTSGFCGDDYRIVNSLGYVLLAGTIDSGSFHRGFHLSSLSKGIYLLILRNEVKTELIRIIIR